MVQTACRRPTTHLFEMSVWVIATKGAENPIWSIDLANDSVSTQQHILNAHGVYELPRIETPGMPPTLRLLINDTALNNQTEIFCTGESTSNHSTLFILGKSHKQSINANWVIYSNYCVML